MVSTFDKLLVIIEEYPFDIVTMSETWLKDNRNVTIPARNTVMFSATVTGFGAVALVLT